MYVKLFHLAMHKPVDIARLIALLTLDHGYEFNWTLLMASVRRKSVFRVSAQVRRKHNCTTTDDG